MMVVNEDKRKGMRLVRVENPPISFRELKKIVGGDVRIFNTTLMTYVVCDEKIVTNENEDADYDIIGRSTEDRNKIIKFRFNGVAAIFSKSDIHELYENLKLK